MNVRTICRNDGVRIAFGRKTFPLKNRRRMLDVRDHKMEHSVVFPRAIFREERRQKSKRKSFFEGDAIKSARVVNVFKMLEHEPSVECGLATEFA